MFISHNLNEYSLLLRNRRQDDNPLLYIPAVFSWLQYIPKRWILAFSNLPIARCCFILVPWLGVLASVLKPWWREGVLWGSWSSGRTSVHVWPSWATTWHSALHSTTSTGWHLCRIPLVYFSGLKKLLLFVWKVMFLYRSKSILIVNWITWIGTSCVAIQLGYDHFIY